LKPWERKVLWIGGVTSIAYAIGMSTAFLVGLYTRGGVLFDAAFMLAINALVALLGAMGIYLARKG
jgi:hypothetical protein